MSTSVNKFDLARQQRRESVYIMLAIVPPLVVTAMLVYGAWRERRASGTIETRLAALVAENEPIGNGTLTRFYDSRTTRSTTQAWSDIFAATRALSTKYDITSESEFGEVISAGADWPAAAFANQFSDDAQVIINQIRRLSVADTPTWQPILFTDITTLLPELQESRDVREMLANEFRAAYHAADHSRAVESLAMIQTVETALDWQTVLVGELVRLASRNERYQLIRDSLRSNFWRADDLKQLLAQLRRPDDLDSRWRHSLAGERAMIFASLRMTEAGGLQSQGVIDNVNLTPFGISTTHQLSLLNVMDRVQSIAGVGTAQHVRSAADWNWFPRSWAPLFTQFSITSIPFALGHDVNSYYVPSIQAASEAFARSEESRRMTITAIGVKLFEREHGVWPESVTGLSQVGITPDEMHLVDAVAGSRFGYRVSRGGQEAVVWTSRESFMHYGQRNADNILPTERDKTLEDHEIHIR